MDFKITDVVRAVKAGHFWFDCGCQANALILEDQLWVHWTTYKASGAHHHQHEGEPALAKIRLALERGVFE